MKPLWKTLNDAWWSPIDTENPTICPPEGDQWAFVLRRLASVIHAEKPEDTVKWLLAEAIKAEGL